MKAAIIAAGHGERLRAAGYDEPKPLVRVAGTPLIEHTLNTLRAVGISDVACIVNDEASAVAAYCAAHCRDLALRFVQRTTPSSMESLFTLAPLLGEAPFFLLTVDAIVEPAAAARFVHAAAACSHADGVLAVNAFIADEKPLYVAHDGDGRITALGNEAAASPVITAGFYVFRPTIFAEIAAARAAHLTALRQFLAHLVRHDYRLFAATVPKCIDVDRPEDIALAEAFIRGGYQA